MASVLIRPDIEDRIREITRQEIAAWLKRQPPTSTHGGGTMSYREYLHSRDEPPAAPPTRGVNTTERL